MVNVAVHINTNIVKNTADRNRFRSFIPQEQQVGFFRQRHLVLNIKKACSNLALFLLSSVLKFL